jgi:hypothetical protein
MIEKRAVELTNSRSYSRFRLDSIFLKREMLDRDIHLEIILAPPPGIPSRIDVASFLILFAPSISD